ncbi:MAG: minor capsid protein [Lachnospiraceae bacterium]
MPRIHTRVTFHTPSAVATIRAASNSALTDTGNQILQDATKHVPEDQGTLKNSGITNSDREASNGKFMLRWSTPYAKYLWNGDVMYGNPTNRTYGPKKISFTSALAHEEWAKYAKNIYGDDWKRVYQAALRRRIGRGSIN